MTERHLLAPKSHVTRAMREKRNRHGGGVFWFTGLSGAGKSTIAHGVEKLFFDRGRSVAVFDGDVIRKGLCSDLGFSPEERMENIRRIAEVARIFAQQGTICLCAFISPLKEHRELASAILGDDYHEIFVSCSVEQCEERDVKGFYKMAREGKIKNYTGISAPYDIPQHPGLVIKTDEQAEVDSIAAATAFISSKIALSAI